MEASSPNIQAAKLDSLLMGFKRVSDGAYVFGKWLLIFAMSSIVALVLIDILFRYVINMPLIWPQEITKWSLVWVGYIGAGVALRTERHVALTMVINRLGERAQAWVLLFGKLIILFFVSVFIWLGYQQAIVNPAFSWAVNIRYTYAMLGMPLAGLLMFMHLIYLITKDIYSLLYGRSPELQSFAENTNP